VSSYCKNLN